MADKRYRRGGTGAALYVTVAVAFVLIAIFAALGLFFKIKEINVTGNERYTAEEIIAASGFELDNSVFFISKSSAEVAIKSALPYVDTVRILTKLPGTVNIELTETRAVASFTSGGSRYLIDPKCRVVEKTDAPGEGIMEIRGVSVAAPELGKGIKLEGADESGAGGEAVRQKNLEDMISYMGEYNMLGNVTWLDLTNMASITFQYNGYEVNLKGGEDLDVKFASLMQYLATKPEHGSGTIVFSSPTEMIYNPIS